MGTSTPAKPPLYDKIPDPRFRLVNDVGEGFLIGAALGSAVYGVKGFRSSPAGGGRRLAGAARGAVAGAPRVGGFLGVYSALFCALEGAMALARRKDDAWNSIAAGAASLGLLHVPLGGRTAAVSALFAAAVEVVLEGASWVVAAGKSDDSRVVAGLPTVLAPATTPVVRTESPLSWLRSSASVPTPLITSKKDFEVPDLSRKFLLEKMKEGFYSPSSVEYGLSSVRGGNPI